jgi:hypothetical protein
MCSAHFFWLEIALNTTRTRMTPAIAVAATGHYGFEQCRIRRAVQQQRWVRRSRIQQDVRFHGLPPFSTKQLQPSWPWHSALIGFFFAKIAQRKKRLIYPWSQD